MILLSDTTLNNIYAYCDDILYISSTRIYEIAVYNNDYIVYYDKDEQTGLFSGRYLTDVKLYNYSRYKKLSKIMNNYE
jgi:hypothetical protein